MSNLERIFVAIAVVATLILFAEKLGVGWAVAIGIIGTIAYMIHEVKESKLRMLSSVKSEIADGINVSIFLPRHGNVIARFLLRVGRDGEGMPSLTGVTIESSGRDVLTDLTNAELSAVNAACQLSANEAAQLITKLDR